MEFNHKSVLFEESMRLLSIRPDGIYVDGTLGGGGHAYGICSRLKDGRLIGIDRDKEAIAAAQERLSEFSDRTAFVNENYAQIKQILKQLEIQAVDGALLDLGVSSYQLDNPARGFSYMQDAPLDMRMNSEDPLSADDVVNTYSEQALFKVIRDYGEEKWAKRIASFIVEKRPVHTTFELSDVIKAAIPAGARKDGPHPAKRTFQAIRIEVNGELEKLKAALQDFFDCLRPGGNLAVITFHSLEDRIVKQLFQQLTTGCTCPKELPVCVCDRMPKGTLINRKPITAAEQELEENPRARSAKLRGIKKI